VICLTGSADGQETAAEPSRRFGLREVTTYSSWYSSGLPDYFLGAGGSLLNRRSDIAAGGAMVFGYSSFTERSNIAFRVTPSYTGRVRYSDLASFSNSVDLQFGRAISPRLRFVVATNANVMNREEIQFGVRGDLLDSDIPGVIPDPGTVGIADPSTQALFFGSRILTATAHTGLQYAVTPRLSISVGGGGMRTQYLSNRSFNGEVAQPFIPHVTAGLADVNLTYRLSPRTNIGGHVAATNQRSAVQDSVITNYRGSADRALTPRLSVSGYGGIGQFRGSLQVPQVQYLAGGGVNFRAGINTFTVAADRRISDIYGVGSSSTLAFSGTWRLDRRAGWVSSSYGWTKLDGALLAATTMRGTFEVGRRLTGNAGIMAGYAYIAFRNTPLLGNNLSSQHAVRFALTWMPFAPRPVVDAAAQGTTPSLSTR
jgi:hypothetical protein